MADENDSVLLPIPPLTVDEFVAKAKNLLDEMLEDHHGATGIDHQTWDEWLEDLNNAYINN